MLTTLAVTAVVGHSAEGRPIELVHVPGPGPLVLVVGCVHGDECAGIAVVAALRRSHPDVTIWFHQHQDLVRAWGRSQALAQRYARLAGMRYERLEWPRGAVTRWQNAVLDERSFVVELPAGRLSAATAQRHVRAVLAVAR